MNKKILISLVAVAAVIAGISGFSAFEAHIINVTATIENGLKVSSDPIDFGTVFPQEYIEKPFEISLSDSFLGEGRVDDVKYVIKQKLKPCPLAPGVTPPAPIDPTCVADTAEATPENPTGFHYLNLCPFLSKVNTDTDGTAAQNDTSHPSYFTPATSTVPASCQTPGPDATGELSKILGDTVDGWIVDLKVPPVAGTVGQDWPTGCPTVPDNDKTYGCDLWIEATGISTVPTPTPTPTASVSPTPTPTVSVSPTPTPTPTPTPEIVISTINIGDTASEANLNATTMQGWSNTVWPGIGGGWGGGDDGTIRTISAPIPDDNYKGPFAAELPSTDSATIVMDFGAASATKKLQVRHLDGTAVDSFNVYVDGVLVGSYADSTNVETWLTGAYNVSAYNGLHTIRIQLTGPHWANYNLFGQLGISWLKIVQ